MQGGCHPLQPYGLHFAIAAGAALVISALGGLRQRPAAATLLLQTRGDFLIPKCFIPVQVLHLVLMCDAKAV